MRSPGRTSRSDYIALGAGVGCQRQRGGGRSARRTGRRPELVPARLVAGWPKNLLLHGLCTRRVWCTGRTSNGEYVARECRGRSAGRAAGGCLQLVAAELVASWPNSLLLHGVHAHLRPAGLHLELPLLGSAPRDGYTLRAHSMHPVALHPSPSPWISPRDPGMSLRPPLKHRGESKGANNGWMGDCRWVAGEVGATLPAPPSCSGCVHSKRPISSLSFS